MLIKAGAPIHFFRERCTIARQTPKVDQALAEAQTTSIQLNCGVGTQSPTCTSVELGRASDFVHSQP